MIWKQRKRAARARALVRKAGPVRLCRSNGPGGGFKRPDVYFVDFNLKRSAAQERRDLEALKKIGITRGVLVNV